MNTKTKTRDRSLSQKHIDYVNAHDGKLPPGMSVKEFIRRGAIELKMLPKSPAPQPRKHFKRLTQADMDYIDRNDGHLPHKMTIEQYEALAGVVGLKEPPRHLRTEDWPGCPVPKMTIPGVSCPRCGAHPLEVAGEFFRTGISVLDSKRTQIPYTEADKEAVRILRAAYMESTASDTLYNARQYLQDRARYERNMLHCECGQATTPEQLERANRFGIKADPRGHVHSFHGVSA